MNQEDIIAYFDRQAPLWDQKMVRRESAICRILDQANVREGAAVLDVACGTGVLIPDYLRRGAKEVTAVDISPEMVRIAAEKYREEPKVQVICADACTISFGPHFDVCMLYNALPHFDDPEHLIKVLSGQLVPGGVLSVAHGFSRETINKRHGGSAKPVSVGLMEAFELREIMSRYVDVYVEVSDEEIYQVCGRKR